MRKEKLLYASPFPPMKSGIADYSVLLIYALRSYFDITLLIDDYKLADKNLYKDFKVKKYHKKMKLVKYRYRIYNIGNNPDCHSYLYDCALHYPGLVILHDLKLYFLIIGHYINRDNFYLKIYAIAGAFGISVIKPYAKKHINLLSCKELAAMLPMNKELLDSGNLFMVHSHYAYNTIVNNILDAKKIKKINLINALDQEESYIDKSELCARFSIPQDSFIIASFGFIDQTKLNHIVCDVVKELSKRYRTLTYVMVGEGDYIDGYVSHTIIKTGFVTLLEFNSLMYHADLIINLRNPSMGETSAALVKALSFGKPCIVSNDAWFAELPDDVVIKIENNTVTDTLLTLLPTLLEKPAIMQNLSAKASLYARNEHDPKKIAADIVRFLKQ